MCLTKNITYIFIWFMKISIYIYMLNFKMRINNWMKSLLIFMKLVVEWFFITVSFSGNIDNVANRSNFDGYVFNSFELFASICSKKWLCQSLWIMLIYEAYLSWDILLFSKIFSRKCYKNWDFLFENIILLMFQNVRTCLPV